MNSMPFHKVNVMTGTKYARMVEEGGQYAKLVQKAKRPLMILGSRCISETLDGMSLIDWAVEIAKTADIPICATAHTKKSLMEKDHPPACSYDLMEILNQLKNPGWMGVRGDGNHDLVLFLGVRTDMASAGLSAMKHFAPHLKTMTLDKYYFPHADYSMPNFKKEMSWLEFVRDMLTGLRSGTASG